MQLNLAQDVQIAEEAIGVLVGLGTILKPIIDELKSKDDLVTKIKAVVADIEANPADIINNIKSLIASVESVFTPTPTTTPSA